MGVGSGIRLCMSVAPDHGAGSAPEHRGSAMADQIAMSPESVRAAAGPEFDAAELHIASAGDVADERGRDSRFRALLARGDLRDQAAERRDRTAEVRSPVGVDPLGWLDRDWAGRDRDA